MNKVIAKIKEVQSLALKEMKDNPGLADTLNMQLDKVIALLEQRSGGGAATTEVFGKVTTLKGQELGAAKPTPAKVQKQNAEDQAVEELKAQVDLLEPLFLKIETAKILDEHSSLAILGVAKRAGLPVTEETKVNAKFVEEIKTKLQDLEL